MKPLAEALEQTALSKDTTRQIQPSAFDQDKPELCPAPSRATTSTCSKTVLVTNRTPTEEPGKQLFTPTIMSNHRKRKRNAKCSIR